MRKLVSTVLAKVVRERKRQLRAERIEREKILKQEKARQKREQKKKDKEQREKDKAKAKQDATEEKKKRKVKLDVMKEEWKKAKKLGQIEDYDDGAACHKCNVYCSAWEHLKIGGAWNGCVIVLAGGAHYIVYIVKKVET